MKKPTQIVMLPTEEGMNIPAIQYQRDGSYSLDFWDSEVVREEPIAGKTVYEAACIVPQHLYITVDQEVEPIKEGDWCLINDVVCKVEKDDESPKWLCIKLNGKALPSLKGSEDGLRKIIATTDPKLTKSTIIGQCNCDCHKPGNVIIHFMACCNPTVIKGVPELEQSFIKEYCDKGGIDEVMVEYFHYADAVRGGNPNKPIKLHKLKLNQDNTITLYLVEEKMYSREEVTILFNKLNSDFEIYSNYKTTLEDWIKENL